MRIDLLHNKIVAGSVTPRFTECISEELLPLLSAVYPELEGVLMYEDFLGESLLSDGMWHYPFTVFVDGEAQTAFVAWPVDAISFKGACPYSYVGEGPIGFTIPEQLPEGALDMMRGRAIAYDENTVRVRIVTKEKDPHVLVGRYSQTFVDELARQLTAELKRTLAVEGIEGGTLELQLVFASDTYMEHTSDNVTYRRLLLTDKGCQPRDFWVKWTRLDGAFGYSVTDHVSAEAISFEIGEDVPQKVREKEFRFLCRSNPDKYQSAMGKKKVTEWRELIKRSIRRGELIKLEIVQKPAEDDIDSRLKAVLGEYAAATEDAPEVDDSDIAMMARAALGEDVTPLDEEETWSEEDATPAVWTPDGKITEDEGYTFGLDAAVEPADEPVAEPAEEAPVADEPVYYEPVEEVPVYRDPVDEPAPVASAPVSEDDYAELERLREERLRREIEARLRLEYEAEARAKAEAEAERLRLEHERLRKENERLREEARLREEERARAEQERLAEIERLREEDARRREEEERTRQRIAEQARIEEAERARLAEIARQAVEEQARLERERAAREAEEQRARERLERERIAREEAERAAEARRLEEEKRRKEEEARRRAQPVFVTKHAKLIFRRSVDLNVIKRIKEIVEQTLISESKAHVHIYMKAYPIDSYTINLDMKLPDSEMELLVTIVKAIGNGHLGITKIIVE